MLIQVMGQKGMLGSAVVRAIARRGHQIDPHQCDITTVTPGHIHASVIINCAGLVKQRSRPDHIFMLVNGYAPHLLKAACEAVGSRLIHVSTDCVFQGPGPHYEEDTPDAFDIYARSKLAGEVYAAPHLTVRTSFVGFGPRGLLHDLAAGLPIKASKRLLWSGHTVDTVADVLITLAEQGDIVGLLHIPGEEQSRWELAHRLKERFDLPSPIEENTYRADRRLWSRTWEDYDLPALPSFDAQLETMERAL